MKYIIFALTLLATSAQAAPRVDLYTGIRDEGFLWNDGKRNTLTTDHRTCSYKWRCHHN